MQSGKYSFSGRLVILLFMLVMAYDSHAATRAFDRIEVKTGDEENIITVLFNIPVRYVSHVMNDANSEIGIQLQILQSLERDIVDLVQTDQLTWNPSAEVPLNKVDFQGELVGTSSLLVSFASPVKDFKIRQGKDFYRMDFILKKAKAVVEVPIQEKPKIVLDVPETRPPQIFRDLPLVIYAINLTSEQKPIDLAKVAPISVGDDKSLYVIKTIIKDRPWYRLRLGFYRTMDEAKAQLKKVHNFYPKAWVDRADIEERRQALRLTGKEVSPMTSKEGLEKPVVSQPQKEPMLPVDDRLTKMMELTRRTMTAGEYAKAIRMLEAILEEPNNYYTKEARELMGLARERNNQIAHAKAEYRTYLELYPEGEDADRVRQRLQGLMTATLKPRERMRPEPELEAKPRVEWETFGSLSQNYRRESIDAPFVDEEDSVSTSEIETFIDFNTRRRGEEFDMRAKLTTSYVYGFLDEEDADDSTLTDAYFDLEHTASRANMRLGRQRLRASGVLNRFDGLALGYELTPDIRVRGVAGLPVERSSDMFLNDEKYFAGISGDVSDILDNWDVSLYFIEQRVENLVDRRAVGGEIRYFDPVRSLFSLVDYDIFYNTLDTFTLQGNWTLANQARLYMNLDYRNTPVLLTSNAVIGQNNPDLYPDVVQPIDSIDELQQFLTDDEIYDRAEDLTTKTKTAAIGVNWPLSTTLQLSGDLTVVNTDGISQLGTARVVDPVTGEELAPQSPDFVEEIDGTGTDFFYTFQVVKNDLLKKGDIGIFSLRYADTSFSNTYQLSASSRYPVTNFLRINPKFTTSYRENEQNDGNRLRISPFLQVDYRIRKSITLELESGLNWFKEDDGEEVTEFTDYFFLAGYRWDF